jgi:hypothetical protein
MDKKISRVMADTIKLTLPALLKIIYYKVL